MNIVELKEEPKNDSNDQRKIINYNGDNKCVDNYRVKKKYNKNKKG